LEDDNFIVEWAQNACKGEKYFLFAFAGYHFRTLYQLMISAMGISLRSTLHAIKTLYTDMAHRATGIGSKSSLTIMAGATIFAIIKRLHGEIIILFRGPALHLKNFIMTAVAFHTCVHGMGLMGENNRLHRRDKNNRRLGAVGIFIILFLPDRLPSYQDKKQPGKSQYTEKSRKTSLINIHIFILSGN